ncbi:MAG: DUF1080 domain-containing protein [Planctomycetes bacterium]|nr:DUF1080 domain-containing protein [Planctomycetota bacterium]
MARFALALLLASCAAAPRQDSTIELFNGRDLSGWRPIGDARWEIEGGELVGSIGGGSQSFLATEREFSNFVLELELKNELPGNSGVQVRSHQNEQGRVFGYQIEIDPSDRAWSGGLYDEGRRGWLANLKENPEARAAFRRGEWNCYRIELLDHRIRTWVNGVPAVDTTDDADASGFIALQVHSGNNTRMRFRNLRLTPLP